MRKTKKLSVKVILFIFLSLLLILNIIIFNTLIYVPSVSVFVYDIKKDKNCISIKYTSASSFLQVCRVEYWYNDDETLYLKFYGTTIDSLAIKEKKIVLYNTSNVNEIIAITHDGTERIIWENNKQIFGFV